MNIYIDSENVSPKSFNKLLEKYSSNNDILNIKIFCDFGDEQSNSWYKLCQKYINDVKIEPIQCMKKPKMGSIDNMIQAEVFEDVLYDCKRKSILKRLIIFSNDSDYNPLIKKITNHGYNIELQKDDFSESNVKEKKEKSVVLHVEEQSNKKQLEISMNDIEKIRKRLKCILIKLKDKFENKKITLQDYFSAINQLLIENIKRNIKSDDLIEIKTLKNKLKEAIISNKENKN